MIDHVTLLVRDYARTRDAYLKALAPLGYQLVMELSRAQIPQLPARIFGGLGVGGKPDLWLREADGPITPTHLALRADSHAVVDAFYQAALAAGLSDNGPPGPRPQYHAKYYGAFVLDFDGYNLEACCHT